jgi:molybdate transport system ATP-binding protein
MTDTGLKAELALSMGGFSLEAALSVAPGETLVLMGPNGAGKTTCLNLIAGLLRPERGRITLDGVVLCDTEAGLDFPPERRSVGFLFQDGDLFPHLTVRQNAEYGPRARGRGRAETSGIVAGWLDRLGLTELADRRAKELSGGQRRRAALARALASGARLLLLDEPFASLDATSRASVRAEMKGFLEMAGLPALAVAHDPVDAFVLGDRIAVLEGGRVVQTGTGEELLAHPRSPFVAELIGLNFYRVDLSEGVGLKEARAKGAVFHVLADGLSGSAHLAFAPSDVSLSAEAPRGSPQNVFQGTVREIIPLTDRLRVIVDAGTPMAAEITRDAAQQLSVASGAVIWVSVKASAIRVYP